jgi:DNA-binding transcriptional LysR family regulator
MLAAKETGTLPSQPLSERLPRVSGLVMFEAAARHLSFTLAAQELGVTQAAVSQQIRALEREMSVTLFERLHRGLRLTRQGLRLHRAVTTGFEHIAQTADDLRSAAHPPALTLGVTFAIATYWLVPRLAAFRAQHPEVNVHLFATDRGFETVADQVDAGIAFGMGGWAGFQATPLRDGVAFPVCSPAYLEGRPKLTRVEQLLDETLLSLQDTRMDLTDWPAWLASQGVQANPRHRPLQFNSHTLLLQAALEGQGIALGWSLLTDELLARGALVRPLPHALRSPRGFWFVMASGKRSAAALAFRDWLLAQFAADSAEVA